MRVLFKNGRRFVALAAFSALVCLNLSVGISPTRVFATPPSPALGAWSRVGNGYPNFTVIVTTFQQGNLYIGGYFTDVVVPSAVKYGNGCDDTDTFSQSPSFPLPTTRCVAQWDGTSWSNLGGGVWGTSPTGLDNRVIAIADDGTNVFVGGVFTMAGDFGIGSRVRVANVARWNRSTNAWTAMSPGVDDGTIFSMVIHDSALYAAGGFIANSSGPNFNRIARWTGSQWVPLGEGLNALVYTLASNGTSLFAGGDFTATGGVSANHVAQWDGTNWSALGAGLNGVVRTLVGDGTNLFAGGSFTSAGESVNTSRIAKWTGSSWVPVGVGLNGDVYGLAIDSPRGLLYAVGAFTAENGGTIGSLNRVAVFDTTISRWIPLEKGGGNDPDSSVGSVALDGSTVYIGGGFAGDLVGGGDYQNLAKWTWSAPTGSNTLSAIAGNNVTITGEGFVGVPATGGVKFGTTVASYTRTSTSQITANVPAGLSTGTYTISVNGVGGWADVGTASVTALPQPPAVTPPTTTTTISPPTTSPAPSLTEIRAAGPKAAISSSPNVTLSSSSLKVRSGPVTATVECRDAIGRRSSLSSNSLSLQGTACRLNVQARGYAANTPVRLFLISRGSSKKTRNLGMLVTSGSGGVDGVVTIRPALHGRYFLQINGEDERGKMRSINLPLIAS